MICGDGLVYRTLYLGGGEGRLGGRSIGWSPGNVAWGLWAGRAWRYGNKAVNGALQGMSRAWRDAAAGPGGKRWGRPDVVLAHFGQAGDIAACLRELGAFSAPIATVMHGVDVSEPLLAGKPLYPRLKRSGELILPISHRWASAFLDQGFEPSRVVVHRVGVTVPEAKASTPPPYRPGETLRLMTVCRLVEKKGTAVTLDALAELKRRGGPPFVFTIVGDGPLRASLERRVTKLGLDDEVTFTGGLPRDRVVEQYRAHHLFVLPSVTSSTGDQEGVPTVLMEAMARGLVAVSTLHSGIPELVEDGVGGRLVPEHDATALASAIRELAERPQDWPPMQRSARAKVEAEFEINKLNDRLATLLADLAATGVRTGSIR